MSHQDKVILNFMILMENVSPELFREITNVQERLEVQGFPCEIVRWYYGNQEGFLEWFRSLRENSICLYICDDRGNCKYVAVIPPQ